MMFTKIQRKQRDSLTVPNIAERTLPPLPISKRQLPGLPQSKSSRIRGNQCKNQATNKKINSTKIVITPPDAAPHGSTIRNFIRKMKGGSTKKHNQRTHAPYTHTDIESIRLNPSKWRPSLCAIMDDDELLDDLIAFMTKQYNEESILFLQSVAQLNSNIRAILIQSTDSQINIVKQEKIDVEITSIYNTYITSDAAKQVNLSSGCFNEVMCIRQKFSNLPLSQKASLFERSVSEIECLIQTSILGSFYRCDEFQCVAHSRNILDNCQMHSPNVSDENEYDSDDVEYLTQSETEANVVFDCHSVSTWTEKNKYMMATKGFASNSGIHEWSIKILKTNGMRQEFGVVSVCGNNTKINEFGICDTPSMGARSVYGFNNMNPTFYYASYNKNNTVRCSKNLSALSVHKKKQWHKGDVITICLNMRRHSIKYFLNGQQVRKTVSIQKNTTLYPIILYSGNCEYKVLS